MKHEKDLLDLVADREYNILFTPDPDSVAQQVLAFEASAWDIEAPPVSDPDASFISSIFSVGKPIFK